MFLRNGKADTSLSLTGPLAVGVPGALAAYDYAVQHYGRMSLRNLLLPAARLAEQGFAINRHYASVLAASAGPLQQFEAARRIFLRPDGSAPKAGAVIQQPDLARTYRAIAEQGSRWFYNGPFAQAAGDWMKTNGGPLAAEDFTALPGENSPTGADNLSRP